MLLLLAIQATVLVPHTFTYRSGIPVKSVAVAGSFNNWNKDATPMHLAPDNTSWTVTIEVSPGQQLYKFVVDGSRWITDPENKDFRDDGSGNLNSAFVVQPPGFSGSSAINDGKITASALLHSTAVPDLNYDGGRLTLSIRTRLNDVAHVFLKVENRPPLEMRLARQDGFFATYKAVINWDRKRDLTYSFELRDGDLVEYFGPKGASKSPNSSEFSLVAKSFKPLIVPTWVEHSVLYQIFPDRFSNGDPTNDGPGTIPWDGEPTYFSRLGGDFAGVEQKLGYLKSLGITCAYYTPIFESPSYHGYETADYLKIDHRLGTNEQFSQLTKRMESMGIRTVLDGVFNHTATSFAPFADVVKNESNSKFLHWYTFHGFPVSVGGNPNYDAWFNYPSLPKLNHANPEVRDYLFNVVRYWDQRAAISGWRLDAAEQVPFDFWRQFRPVVKERDSDRWIVGEFWGDGSPWLRGDAWDSVMNYQFRNAVIGFVGSHGDGKPSQLMNRLLTTYASYAPQVSRNMMNLVGSHDTARILTECGGNRKLADLAAALEFSWVGAPMVYYGDELGMSGGKDPDNRRGMRWDLDNVSNPTLKLYRRLIAIRKSSPELQSGEPITLLTDDNEGTLAFARVLNKSAVIIALNRSAQPRKLRIQLKVLPAVLAQFRDSETSKVVIVDAYGTMTLHLQPYGSAILLPKRSMVPQTTGSAHK